MRHMSSAGGFSGHISISGWAAMHRSAQALSCGMP